MVSVIDPSLSDALREEALRRYGVLDLGPRRQMQSLVDLAALVCDVPMAAINLIGATDQHRVATVGIGTDVCSRDGTMCSTSMLEEEPVFVPDARLDARFRNNVFVTGERGAIRFYASHQLRTPEGVVIGTLCVFDVTPRDLSGQQFASLGTLAERVVDVLELELTTRELARVNERLATSNERLGAFAGQVSHDLMNPLSSITMSLEMAQDAARGLPRDHRQPLGQLLDRAGRGAGRMDSMVRGLLEFARGGADPILHPVDLGRVVEEVIEDLHVSAGDLNLRWVDLPVVHVDEVQMRALLQNLIANAIKFTRSVAHPEVVLTGSRTATGCRVEVCDNGPGIREQDRERVFDVFARVDHHLPGAGIGLSTCRRIVEAHGGRIGVAPSSSSGALVWFELPDPVLPST